ncbi:aminopeptidase N-like [Glandiceps talaboti]
MASKEPFEEDIQSSKSKSNGCYISKTTFVLLVAVVVLLLFGVALLFYFVPSGSSGHCAGTMNVIDDTECPPMPAVPDDPPPAEVDPFDGRLSDDVRPSHYVVTNKLYLDPEDGELQYSFEGDVLISVHCYVATSTIKVHRRSMTVHLNDTHVMDSTLTEVELANVYEDDDLQLVFIETAVPLQAGEDYTIHMKYEGPLNLDFHGMYRSFYNVGPGAVDLVATQFQATAARKAFPCFDEPRFKATFDMIIVHRDRRNALSNMPVVQETYLEDDWLETKFDTTVVMPTYLLAILVSDFPYLEIVDNGFTFRVWSQPDYIEAANYSLHIGIQMLRFFEEHYGIVYPLPKMDMVAVPQFAAGAMENWGLILYSENTMIYDPEVNTPSRKQTVAIVVAHELAHMWFGNLVTLDWWEHIWLNEGYASFLTYMAVDHVEPTWKFWDSFHVIDMETAYRVDSRSSSSRPIVQEVGWSNEILGMFDSITYSKGSCIVRHLRALLDEDIVLQAHKDYLNTHAYGNVVTDDLWAALTEADQDRKGTPVKAIMDTWVLQAGHPVVNITRTGTSTVVASQTYFMLDPNDFYDDTHPDVGYVWYVPLTYTDSANPDFLKPKEELLYKDPIELDLVGVEDNDWVLFNIDKWGFYRVNYDDDNWQKLATQLKTDHTVITDQSRASMIDDAFHVSQPFHTDNVNALRLTEYMDKELAYVIWETVILNLGYTHDMLLRTSEFYLFEMYWSNQVTPLYESLGWDFSLGGHLDYFQRINAIDTACIYGQSDCVNEALTQYRDWMSSGQNNIRDEVRPTVYCTAIRHGGIDEWEFAYDETVNNNPGITESNRLQSAMGCTEKSWLLQRYLEDDNFVASNVITDIRDKSAVGYSLAWDYAMNNFDTLGLTYNTIWNFQDYMNTQYDLDQLKAFGSRHYDMSESDASGFYDAIERVETNIAWMNRNKDSMKEWLLDVTATMTTSAKETKADIPRPDVSSPRRFDNGALIQDGKFGGEKVSRTSEAIYQLIGHYHG